MIETIIAWLIFAVGFMLGTYWRGARFDSSPWVIYRWHKDSFGYRPIQVGTTIARGDNVIMALQVNTEHFPDGGIRYE